MIAEKSKIDHELPTAGTSGCSSANDDNNNHPSLMTTPTPSSDNPNPVEFSIPDEFYQVPEDFDLDLDLVGKQFAETTTEAVPLIDPVAAQTPPAPVLPTQRM